MALHFFYSLLTSYAVSWELLDDSTAQDLHSVQTLQEVVSSLCSKEESKGVEMVDGHVHRVHIMSPTKN